MSEHPAVYRDIERLLAEARNWHSDMPGSDCDTPLGQWLELGPALIAAVKACEHAGVCKLCDRLVRIHGHRAGCPIAPFSFEEQA